MGMGGLHSDFSLNSNIRIFGLLCLQLICTQVLTIIIIKPTLQNNSHTQTEGRVECWLGCGETNDQQSGITLHIRMPKKDQFTYFNTQLLAINTHLPTTENQHELSTLYCLNIQYDQLI